MKPILDFLRPLQENWNKLALSQRVTLVAALVLSVAAIMGVLYWATSPDYVPLANQLTPAQSAEIISLLEGEGIPYQLNFSGSALSVPRQRLNAARLAASGLIDANSSSSDYTSEQSPWDPPALQADRLLRQQEQRLARSISKMKGVRGATIHIGRSEPTPFMRQSTPTTASVVIDLQPGWQLGAQQAASIMSLVAHGVDGLSTENVTLMDTDGRLLSTHSRTQADVSAQLEYKNRLEMDLVAKAETMLEQMLGPGRAAVRVTADIDFTDTKRTETRFDPNGKAKKNETVTSISQLGQPPGTSGGPPGTASNLASSTSVSRKDDLYKEEHTSTDYENAKVDETIHELPGKLLRLTIAAIVDLPRPADGEPATGPQLTDVEAIIKQAVGYDELRQDKIQVVSAPMAMTDLVEAGMFTTSTWQNYSEIAKNASLGIGGLAALIITFLVLRRVKPIVIESKADEPLSVDQIQQLIKVTNLTRENPAAAARILQSWLNIEPGENDEQPPQTQPLRKVG